MFSAGRLMSLMPAATRHLCHAWRHGCRHDCQPAGGTGARQAASCNAPLEEGRPEEDGPAGIGGKCSFGVSRGWRLSVYADPGQRAAHFGPAGLLRNAWKPFCCAAADMVAVLAWLVCLSVVLPADGGEALCCPCAPAAAAAAPSPSRVLAALRPFSPSLPSPPRMSQTALRRLSETSRHLSTTAASALLTTMSDYTTRVVGAPYTFGGSALLG